jgi:hypothetical protein
MTFLIRIRAPEQNQFEPKRKRQPKGSGIPRPVGWSLSDLTRSTRPNDRKEANSVHGQKIC